MEFELGQTYSGYQFLDVVRRSRSAVQYRVQNTLAQRVESLRTLTAAAGDDPGATERFLREVRIRARLSHPNIVTFYTAVPIDGRMAMTTELPDSISLAERLKLGPLPWREALDIARQLLEALACLHRQSFVHCGITPENIQFGPGVFCKLADFSLARSLDAVHNSDSGAVVGNPRYISPEQVKGECNLDRRSDLYSVGVVLYEMLCGRPPFESRSQFELMMAHVNRAPAPPSSIEAKVPQFLDGLVLKAIAKSAEDRYSSAADFAEAIARFDGEQATETEPVPAAPVVPAMVEAVTVPESTAPEDAAVMVEVTAPLAEIIPEDAVSAEPSPAIVEAVTVPESADVIVDVAAPVAEIIPDDAVSAEPTPAIVEAMAVPETADVSVDVAAPVPDIIPEDAVSAGPSPAIEEAVTVPAPEAPEDVAVMVEVAAPEAEIVPQAAVSAEPTPAIAEATTDPAPEALEDVAVIVEVAAPEAEIVPEASVSPEPAPAIVEAVSVSESAIPESAVEGTVPDDRQQEPIVCPTEANPLQSNLWAAAEMVAKAASTNAAPPRLPPPVSLPLASPLAEPVAAAPPASEAEPIPVFLTNLRQIPGPVQWFVFGGTAAFLGVIWVAIWFAGAK